MNKKNISFLVLFVFSVHRLAERISLPFLYVIQLDCPPPSQTGGLTDPSRRRFRLMKRLCLSYLVLPTLEFLCNHANRPNKACITPSQFWGEDDNRVQKLYQLNWVKGSIDHLLILVIHFFLRTTAEEEQSGTFGSSVLWQLNTLLVEGILKLSNVEMLQPCTL